MKNRKSDGHKVLLDWKTIAGILAFGVLMGARDDFSQLWIRVLLAAVAGGIFGAVRWHHRQPPRK